ncbi:MAG: hypothetical protein ABWZ66_11870 [Pyrinomonadaceae bacterium]
MRNKIASALLITSIVVWGIWCGERVFNELTVIPKWSASPPETIKAYNAIPQKGGAPFFVLFNPLFVLPAIASAVFAWKFGKRIRLPVELRGFVFSSIALRVWSAETQITGEINV